MGVIVGVGVSVGVGVGVSVGCFPTRGRKSALRVGVGVNGFSGRGVLGFVVPGPGVGWLLRCEKINPTDITISRRISTLLPSKRVLWVSRISSIWMPV